jgi:hypothetical protein
MEEILNLLIGNQNQCCETCGHSCKDNKDWEIYWREKLVEFEKKTKEEFLKRILPEEVKINLSDIKLSQAGWNACRDEALTNSYKEGVNIK